MDEPLVVVGTIDERRNRRVVDAPTRPPRIPASIVVVSILVSVDLVFLFGAVVAVMVMTSRSGVLAGIGQHNVYDYPEGCKLEFEKYFAFDESAAKGFAAPTLIFDLFGVFVCLLTLCAELTTNVDLKLKVRNAVGVCWAVSMGTSLAATILWGSTYFHAFLYAPSFSTPFILFPVVLICNIVLFAYSIVLTVLCYTTKYGARCCCCRRPGNGYQLLRGNYDDEPRYSQSPLTTAPQSAAVAEYSTTQT